MLRTWGGALLRLAPKQPRSNYEAAEGVGVFTRCGPVRRSGARTGDLLCSTGVLGDAACGLSLLERDPQGAMGEAGVAALLAALRTPRAHVEEGQFLAESGAVHAMIDVSDGLARDLATLMRASGRGAVVEAEQLPLSESLRGTTQKLGVRSLCKGHRPLSLSGPAYRSWVNRPASSSTGTAAFTLANSPVPPLADLTGRSSGKVGIGTSGPFKATW